MRPWHYRLQVVRERMVAGRTDHECGGFSLWMGLVPAPWRRWRLHVVPRPAKILPDGSLQGWTEIGATDGDALPPWASPDADVAGDIRRAVDPYPEAGGWGP